MKAIIRWTLDHPVATLLLAALVTAGIGSGILQLVEDTSAEAFLPRGHVSFVNKKWIDQTYGIHDSILVSIEDRQSPDIFNPEALRLVKEASVFIENLDGIQTSSMRSLATWEDIQGTEDGFTAQGFLTTIPETPRELAKLRERALSFPLYRGLLVSEDAKVAFLIADVRDDVDIIQVFHDVQGYIAKNVDSRRFRVALTGPPVTTGTLNVYLNQDALLLNPVSVLLTCALLFLMFRSGKAVALPFVVVLPSVAWALGTMGHLGARFTPFSNAIPVVTLAIALSDGIHILGTYYHHRLASPSRPRREVLEEVMLRIWTPILWTSVTTAVGFVALLVTSPMVPVQDFGLAVGVGAMAEMMLSIFVLPAAMLLVRLEVPEVVRKRYEAGPSHGLLDRLLAGLHGLAVRHPLRVIGPVLAVMVLGIAGATRLRVDYNLVDFFPADSEVYLDHQEITRRFAGTHFVDIHLDSGAPEAIFDPAFLRRIETLQADIEGWPQVGKSVSVVQYIKRLNQAVHGDEPSEYRIPDDADLNAQLFFLFSASGDPSQLAELTTSDSQGAHIRVFLRNGRFSDNKPLLDWLETRVARDFPADRYRLGGEAFVNHYWMRLIGQSVINSLLLMFALMFLAGWFLMRNLRAAVLMILPVSMGVLVTYGCMGFLDIPIGLATSIFASIAMGIGIDYAIHYLFHYRLARQEGGSYEEANLKTMSTTGKLVIGNAATVVSGFLVLVLARTVPPNQIGIFVAVGVGASLMTTLLVLGVLTRYVPVAAAAEPRREENESPRAAAVG
jgi:predicted RND superfamily exporter protein